MSQTILIKYHAKKNLVEKDAPSMFYSFKTITPTSQTYNSCPLITGVSFPDELESLLKNKAIINRHCDTSAIHSNARYLEHAKQFEMGSIAANAWDAMVQKHYPNVNQRQDNTIPFIYRHFIDEIIGSPNTGNDQRDYVTELKWDRQKREGAFDRPSRFIQRVEQLWNYSEEMNTTGNNLDALAKAKAVKKMFPESFSDFVKYTAREDLLDDNNGGANPLTLTKIGELFNECWDLNASQQKKVRDGNGNWCSADGTASDSDDDNKSDEDGNESDHDASNDDNDSDSSERQSKRRRFSSDNDDSNKESTSCSLHPGHGHLWEECNLNPANKSTSRFRYAGIQAAVNFLNRDNNKSTHKWYFDLINNILSSQGLQFLSGPSNNNTVAQGNSTTENGQSYYQHPQPQGHWVPFSSYPPTQSSYGGGMPPTAQSYYGGGVPPAAPPPQGSYSYYQSVPPGTTPRSQAPPGAGQQQGTWTWRPN